MKLAPPPGPVGSELMPVRCKLIAKYWFIQFSNGKIGLSGGMLNSKIQL